MNLLTLLLKYYLSIIFLIIDFVQWILIKVKSINFDELDNPLTWNEWSGVD